jgi:hypothetical protein
MPRILESRRTAGKRSGVKDAYKFPGCAWMVPQLVRVYADELPGPAADAANA